MDNAAKRLARVVIAGGSGFLGLNCADYLINCGYDVTILARSKPKRAGGWQYVRWNGRTLDEWSTCLDGATALLNLAGRSVDCIKTPDHCDEILRSRVESTRVLGQALKQIQAPPQVWIQMSTAHAYGDNPTVCCSEDSAFGYGLAPFVATQWESAFEHAVLPQMRPVILRTSFVLGKHGGALQRLLKITRWGLGGTVGSGQQGISWIHEHDMNRLFARAIVDSTMSGAYIATAPNPVSNREFMRSLRHAVGAPLGLPASEWMVRVGAPLIMRTDPELPLYGRYCVSQRLAEEGFEFKYQQVDEALADLLAR